MLEDVKVLLEKLNATKNHNRKVGISVRINRRQEIELESFGRRFTVTNPRMTLMALNRFSPIDWDREGNRGEILIDDIFDTLDSVN